MEAARAVKAGRELWTVIAIFTAIGVCAALSGCSQRSERLFHPAPRSVRISLIQIAQKTSEWSAIDQLDRISLATSRLPPPVTEAAAGSSPSAVEAGEPRPSPAINHAAHAIDSRAVAAALGAAATRAIAGIEARIDRNQTRLMAAARKQSEQRVVEGVEQARRQAVSDYLSALPALLQADAAKRVNLQVQIEALAVNARPSNPVTAPDDHWGKLLAARRAELAALGNPQDIAEKQALKQISDRVAAARTSLQQAEDARLAAYRSGLDARRVQIVARQKAAMQREQADLIAVSNGINAELASSSITSTAQTRSDNAASLQTAVLAAPPPAMPVADDSLKSQRDRMVSQALETTRRRVGLAAQELNLRVVDWNSKKPDAAASRAIVDQIESDIAG